MLSRQLISQTHKLMEKEQSKTTHGGSEERKTRDPQQRDGFLTSYISVPMFCIAATLKSSSKGNTAANLKCKEHPKPDGTGL